VNKNIYIAFILLTLARTAVMARGAQGTGVYINPDGHILTNRHVVEGGCSKLIVEELSGVKIPASITAVSETHDLALLKSERRKGPHAFIKVNKARDATLPPAMGEAVHIVGFPGGEFGPRGGMVTALRDPRFGADGFTVGLSSTFGASGSPVFDDLGLLIGLAWGIAGSGTALKAYVLRTETMLPLLKKVRVGTATIDQAPVKIKPNESGFGHVENIVAEGATVVVKVLCY
jgi:serine protease Do